MNKLLLRVPEAAETLSISRAKAYELIKSGALPSIKIDGSRRIRLDDLIAYVGSLGAEGAA